MFSNDTEGNKKMKKLHENLIRLLDETNAIKVLDMVSDWVREKRTCAMIFQKDGDAIHLISKRDLLDDLKDAWKSPVSVSSEVTK